NLNLSNHKITICERPGISWSATKGVLRIYLGVSFSHLIDNFLHNIKGILFPALDHDISITLVESSTLGEKFFKTLIRTTRNSASIVILYAFVQLIQSDVQKNNKTIVFQVRHARTAVNGAAAGSNNMIGIIRREQNLFFDFTQP